MHCVSRTIVIYLLFNNMEDSWWQIWSFGSICGLLGKVVCIQSCFKGCTNVFFLPRLIQRLISSLLCSLCIVKLFIKIKYLLHKCVLKSSSTKCQPAKSPIKSPCMTLGPTKGKKLINSSCCSFLVLTFNHCVAFNQHYSHLIQTL